jgi:hypothetical protein
MALISAGHIAQSFGYIGFFKVIHGSSFPQEKQVSAPSSSSIGSFPHWQYGSSSPMRG